MGRAVRTPSVDAAACDKLVRTVQSACFVIAIAFFAFGVALALFIPASFEIRASYFVFFGCVPTLGFYLGGHLLGYLTGVVYRLCERIATQSIRTLARCGIGLLDRALPPFLGAINKLAFTIVRWGLAVRVLSHRACSLIKRRLKQAFVALQNFSCLLIRSAALMIISSQGKGSRR